MIFKLLLFFFFNSSSLLVIKSKCIVILYIFRNTCFPGGSGRFLYSYLRNICISFRRQVERTGVLAHVTAWDLGLEETLFRASEARVVRLSSPRSEGSLQTWTARRGWCSKVNAVHQTSWEITQLSTWEQLLLGRYQTFPRPLSLLLFYSFFSSTWEQDSF